MTLFAFMKIRGAAAVAVVVFSFLLIGMERVHADEQGPPTRATVTVESADAPASGGAGASGGAAASGGANDPGGGTTTIELSAAPAPHEAVDRLFAELWPAAHPAVVTATTLAILIAIALLAYLIARWILLVAVDRVARRSRTTWDETLQQAGVFRRLAPIVPMAVIHWGILLVPNLSEPVAVLVQRLALATIAMLITRVLGAALSAINVIYQRYPVSRDHPIKGYLQVVKVVAYIFAGILVFAILMDQSPWFFLSGMGAMMAIIMLVFRDTILSFVAGIQLVNNGVIRVGDWIEMPQLNADGDVIDIALNVVAVQNWDKTVTVIPTHKFLENSFKNWRGMFNSGGRRIKRSIHIDMSSIRFLTEQEIQRFRRFLLLKQYIAEKVQELEDYNREHCPDEVADVIANARRLTNIGTFRAYVTNYLRQHPRIHDDMTFLVRQLQPTSQGLPLEIYVFTTDTRWAFYEGIQADVFDHLLAVLPEFGLHVFQEPSGRDLTRFSQVNGHAEPGRRNDLPSNR